MSKKIIHELDEDELIKLATGSNEPVVMEELSEAAKFIYEMGIKHGDTRIPAQLIYYTYKQWRGWKNKYQPKPFFFRDFSKYFEQVRTSDGMCYLLNKEPFDMSQEAYWLMRKDYREQKAKNKKKT